MSPRLEKALATLDAAKAAFDDLKAENAFLKSENEFLKQSLLDPKFCKCELCKKKMSVNNY